MGSTRRPSEPQASQLWWQALTGQSVEDQRAKRGMGWADMVDEHDCERVLQAWWVGIQSGTPFELEYKVHALSGVSTVFSRCVPVYDERGAVSDWVGMVAIY